LDLIIGSAPSPVLRETLEWAAQNQEMLATIWTELNG
jgi:hypothetical protein